MKDEKQVEKNLYNVKPILFGDGKERVGLYWIHLGDVAMECPFMTVHGYYHGGDQPKGFMKQNCTTACPHATLRQAEDGKSYWRITCSGHVMEREVEVKKNAVLEVVPQIINP